MDAVPFQTAEPFHPLRRPGSAGHTLLRRITAMLDGADEREVLWAAMAAVTGVGPFAPEAAYVVRDGRARRCPALRRVDPADPADPTDPADPRPGAVAADLNAAEADDLADPRPGAVVANLDVGEAADRLNHLDLRVSALDGRSRHLGDPGGTLLRAIALRHRDTCLGYLVLRVLTTPSPEETADADLLARQAGAALAALTRHHEEPAQMGGGTGLSAGEAAQVTHGGAVRTGNAREAGHLTQPAHAGPAGPTGGAAQLTQPAPAGPDAGPGATPTAAALTDLAARSAFHGALSRAAASGQGEQEILQSLHDHTGFPVLAEDRFGNLRAWAGPGRDQDPGPATRPPDSRRDERRRSDLLAVARRGAGAVRDRDRLIVPVEMAGDLLGLVALVDPDLRATRTDADALERTALVLAPELSHERELAALEPRLRHDLVERLVTAEATDDVVVHAATLGHDLRRPHRVAVLQWPETVEGAALGDAVERAAARLRLDALVGARGSTTVALVAEPEPDPGRDLGTELYRTVADELGSAAGAVGTGGRCDVRTDLPHSYDEAVRALTVRRRSQDPHGSTGFEELGLCRMMGTGDGEREADRFVREWLGPLLDYDARHHTDLTTTLSRYLESGGSYDATAEALLIHRSTVRYRLQRIREITGHDLGAVETRLNLHVATRIRNVLDDPH